MTKVASFAKGHCVWGILNFLILFNNLDISMAQVQWQFPFYRWKIWDQCHNWLLVKNQSTLQSHVVCSEIFHLHWFCQVAFSLDSMRCKRLQGSWKLPILLYLSFLWSRANSFALLPLPPVKIPATPTSCAPNIP